MNRMAGTGLARLDIVGVDKAARTDDCPLAVHYEKSQVSAYSTPARACRPARAPTKGHAGRTRCASVRAQSQYISRTRSVTGPGW